MSSTKIQAVNNSLTGSKTITEYQWKNVVFLIIALVTLIIINCLIGAFIVISDKMRSDEILKNRVLEKINNEARFNEVLKHFDDLNDNYKSFKKELSSECYRKTRKAIDELIKENEFEKHCFTRRYERSYDLPYIADYNTGPILEKTKEFEQFKIDNKLSDKDEIIFDNTIKLFNDLKKDCESFKKSCKDDDSIKIIDEFIKKNQVFKNEFIYEFIEKNQVFKDKFIDIIDPKLDEYNKKTHVELYSNIAVKKTKEFDELKNKEQFDVLKTEFIKFKEAFYNTVYKEILSKVYNLSEQDKSDIELFFKNKNFFDIKISLELMKISIKNTFDEHKFDEPFCAFLIDDIKDDIKNAIRSLEISLEECCEAMEFQEKLLNALKTILEKEKFNKLLKDMLIRDQIDESFSDVLESNRDEFKLEDIPLCIQNNLLFIIRVYKENIEILLKDYKNLEKEINEKQGADSLLDIAPKNSTKDHKFLAEVLKSFNQVGDIPNMMFNYESAESGVEQSLKNMIKAN